MWPSCYYFFYLQHKHVCTCTQLAVILSFQKLITVIEELEFLKPEVDHQVNELNNVHEGINLPQLVGRQQTSYALEIGSSERLRMTKNLSSIGNKQVTLCCWCHWLKSISIIFFHLIVYISSSHLLSQLIFMEDFILSFGVFGWIRVFGNFVSISAHWFCSLLSAALWFIVNWFLSLLWHMLQPASMSTLSSGPQNKNHSWVSSNSLDIDKQCQKLWVHYLIIALLVYVMLTQTNQLSFAGGDVFWICLLYEFSSRILVFWRF